VQVNSVPKAMQNDEAIKKARIDLEQMLNQPIKDSAHAERNAMKALQDVKEALKREVEQNAKYAEAKNEAKMMRNVMPAPTEKGPVADAQREMAKGEFTEAINLLEQAVSNFEKMDQKQQQDTVQQMKNLAQQLQQQAGDPQKQQQQMQQQLQNMGMNQQQAQQMAQNMQQAAQGNQQAQQQLQQQAQHDDPFADAALKDAERTAQNVVVQFRQHFPMRFPVIGIFTVVVLLLYGLALWKMPVLDLFGRQAAADKRLALAKKEEQATQAVRKALVQVNSVPKAMQNDEAIKKARIDLEQISTSQSRTPPAPSATR